MLTTCKLLCWTSGAASWLRLILEFQTEECNSLWTFLVLLTSPPHCVCINTNTYTHPLLLYNYFLFLIKWHQSSPGWKREKPRALSINAFMLICEFVFLDILCLLILVKESSAVPGSALKKKTIIGRTHTGTALPVPLTTFSHFFSIVLGKLMEWCHCSVARCGCETHSASRDCTDRKANAVNWCWDIRCHHVHAQTQSPGWNTQLLFHACFCVLRLKGQTFTNVFTFC